MSVLPGSSKRIETDTAQHEAELDHPGIFRNHAFDLAEIQVTYQVGIGRYLGQNHPFNAEPETEVLDVCCALILEGDRVMPARVLSDKECREIDQVLIERGQPSLQRIAERHATLQH